MRSKPGILLAVLLSVTAASAPAAPAFYDLGTLGGLHSHAWGINDSGQVTGSSGLPDGSVHAFRYDGVPGSGGVMHDLGTLGGYDSWAFDINNSGQVAGWSQFSNVLYLYAHAFRYDGTPGSGGVMHDLGTLGGLQSHAWGINDSGQVAGQANLANETRRAFIYTGTPGSGGAMVDLGTLGGTHSEARAINGSGQTVGVSDIAGNATRHAFVYTGTPGSGGVMQDLGTLGGSHSLALDINDSGWIVGQSSTGNNASRAFLYTGTPSTGGVMRNLGTLGGSISSAHGINDAGQIVGSAFLADNVTLHAFLYTGTPGAGGQMIDLDAWLDTNFPAEAAKWTLDVATDLNDAGLITGHGTYNDGPGGLSDGMRAFVLDASSLLEPQPGDFNQDGTVDAADYVLWRKNHGTQLGFDTWRANFGATLGTGVGGSVSPNAVPEASSLVLLTLAVAVLQRRLRLRGSDPCRIDAQNKLSLQER